MNSAKVIRTGFSELSRSAASNYIDKLRREIRRHDYLYYVKDRPEISDEDYDRLHDTLKRLGKSFVNATKIRVTSKDWIITLSGWFPTRPESLWPDPIRAWVNEVVNRIDVVGVTSRRKLYADV